VPLRGEMSRKFLLFVIIFSSSSSLISSQNDDFVLPHTINPQEYSVVLSVTGNLLSRRFTGSLVLTFETLEVDVNEIWLNSRGHQVSQMEATVFDPLDNSITNATITRESDDVIKLALTTKLDANDTYQLLMTFSGNLMITPDGFFRSAYSVFENGVERFMWVF
jgi:Peptidase M1 N-terminal domain